MEDILKYFKEGVMAFWCEHDYTWLCENWEMLIDSGFLIWGWAVLGGLLTGIWKGVKWLWKWRRDRKLESVLRPHYSYAEVKEATRYYITTRGQSISPTDHDESNKLIPRQDLLDLFIDEVFLPSGDHKKFYAILGGAGMGKTTFFINLVLRYRHRLSWQFWRRKNPILLLPLADPKCLERIKKIEEPKDVILLLDALDEDPAVRNQGYAERLDAIVEATQDFRTVLLSSRTQFFPDESQEPGITKIGKHGPSGGMQKFEKIYIAPFSKKDIRKYLALRFPWWKHSTRRKAHKIVERTENVMVRPLVLSYIKALINLRGSNSLYHIYERIIQDWIERESNKPAVASRSDFKENLHQFSIKIAEELLARFRSNQGSFIPESEFEALAAEYNLGLNDLEMKSRSLLNRNAVGEYKFAHKSIWEYFLMQSISSNPQLYLTQNHDGFDMLSFFLKERGLTFLTNMVIVVGDDQVPTFEIGRYPVTQGEWEVVMGTNPSHFKGGPRLPVEQVSWNDAEDFIQKLNKKTGQNYRLPSEKEWKYAAKGGRRSQDYKFAGSNRLTEVGWYRQNSGDRPHPVGEKAPNELDLYDMSGNVWEWCQDIYQVNINNRVIRGGSWFDSGRGCHISNRVQDVPRDHRDIFIGFRLARTP
ncbi:MAG: SUMF1/EgtB/PvdO family nonheme iron enzyme [Bacteroidota bacterium]